MPTIDSVPLDNAMLGWKHRSTSEPLSSYEADLSDLTRAGRDGVVSIPGTTSPVLLRIAVQTQRENLEALISLFRQGKVWGDGGREAAMEFRSVSPTGYGPADQLVDAAFVIRLPGAFRRAVDAETSSVTLSSASVPVTVFESKPRNEFGFVRVNLFPNPAVTSTAGFSALSAQADLSFTGSAVRWTAKTASWTEMRIDGSAVEAGDPARLLVRARASKALTARMRIRSGAEVNVPLTTGWQWFETVGAAGSGAGALTGFIFPAPHTHVAGDWVEVDRVLIAPGDDTGPWFSGDSDDTPTTVYMWYPPYPVISVGYLRSDIIGGLSAPVQDCVIRVKGAATGIQVTDSSGAWVILPDTPAGTWTRFEADTGRCFQTTTDVWTGGTEVSGLCDFGGPRGVFEITPVMAPGDPGSRSGQLTVTTATRSGAVFEVRGKAAYLL